MQATTSWDLAQHPGSHKVEWLLLIHYFLLRWTPPPLQDRRVYAGVGTGSTFMADGRQRVVLRDIDGVTKAGIV